METSEIVEVVGLLKIFEFLESSEMVESLSDVGIQNVLRTEVRELSQMSRGTGSPGWPNSLLHFTE